MIYSRCVQFAVVVLVAQCVSPPPVFAGSSYFNAPSIDGDDPTPGYPDAMAASTVTIALNAVTIVKDIDSASPDLVTAILGGTQLGTSTLLLYNGLPASPPDATLSFFNSQVSSYITLNATTEQVVFNADNPLQLFLELPGIPGESDAPGYANIMQIESFTFTAGDFQIVKLQDDASDDLFLAAANGEDFPAARLLLYNSLLPQGAPDAVVEFHDVQVSSYQTIPDMKEQVSFSFATLSQPIPEPASLALAAAGAALLVATRKRAVRSGRHCTGTSSKVR